MDIQKLIKTNGIIEKIAKAEECLWVNPNIKKGVNAFEGIKITMEDIEDAKKRIMRFAPYIMHCFPETISNGRLIESPLKEIQAMGQRLDIGGLCRF